MANLTTEQTHELIVAALVRSNTSEANAKSVATALVGAELAGQSGHGLRRVESYAAQAASGKVDGHAMPTANQTAPSALAVDAAHGFAYPAMDLIHEKLPEMAKQNGIAMAGVRRSHHCGVAGLIVEKFADQGLVAMMFANTPAAMAPWGGKTALFGTNPIAFAAPQADGAPVVVDVSLSKVARGKIMAANQKGDSIPEGWALGPDGEPTTDPKVGLQGTMVPMGDAKGTALALMVELMAAGLTGANTADNASSFFEAEGAAPGVGQSIIAIDPTKFGGAGALAHMGELIGKIDAEPGARVPGQRRHEIRENLIQNGIEIDDDLLSSIQSIGS